MLIEYTHTYKHLPWIVSARVGTKRTSNAGFFSFNSVAEMSQKSSHYANFYGHRRMVKTDLLAEALCFLDGRGVGGWRVRLSGGAPRFGEISFIV